MIPLSADNKRGMVACNRLLASDRLGPQDKVFVNSVMRQILAKPESFQLSRKQAAWFADLWARITRESK